MMKFYARRSWGNFSVDLHAYEKLDDGGYAIAHPVTIRRYSREEIEGSALSDSRPMWPLETEEAQRLIDALWDVGLRPSEGTGSAGQLAATQKHLEDMRHIVSHHLGLVFPPVK